MDDVKLSLHDGDKEGLYDALQQVPHLANLVLDLKEDGINLVVEVCKKGYTDVLEVLYANDISITSEPNEETPLQIASRYGQAEIVELLLLRGVDVTERNLMPWNEKSPFYIATRNGYHHVLDRLIDHAPQHVLELVKREDVRGCLLYAACLGGHKTTLKRWVAPDININSPIKLVESLEDCEQKTPLKAACEGGHLEIVQFLVDELEASLTRAVCEKYPDITGKIVDKFFRPVESNTEEDELLQLYEGHLRGRQLEFIHPDWLQQYSVFLVHLNISHNCLTELPSNVPWGLQNLRVLNASNNLIKEVAGPTFEDEDSDMFCPSLEEMILSNNLLEKVNCQLFQIPTLVILKLDHNNLSYLARSVHRNVEDQIDHLSILYRRSVMPDIWDCPNLVHLDVSYNTLQLLPIELNHCSGLQKLYAHHNQLNTFPVPWKCPLETLNLSHNQLVRFPVDVEQYWAHTLRHLNISNNCLEEINEGIVKLAALIELEASNNKIERLPTPDPAIWRCTELYNLNLKHNRLGVTRLDSISPKPRFSLPITRRKVSDYDEQRQLGFPSTLSHGLHELRLADNNLDHVPESISQLRALEILDLSSNPLIRTLPKSLGHLQNCSLLKLDQLSLDNVPQEFITGTQNKTKEILSGFLETIRGSQPYNKMKCVVIGKKDKGKTTLVNRLAGKKQQTSLYRDGIVKEEITLGKRKGSGLAALLRDDKRADIKLSLWDMAGDEVYALTHPCVFTSNSLYLLVWDIWTIEDELDQIKAWLYNIKASTPNSRIIIVGTFLDKMSLKAEQKAEIVARLQLKISRLQQEKETFVCPVSCINGEGFEDLKYAMHQIASSMEIPGRRGQKLIGRKVPKSYITMETLVQKEIERRVANKEPPFLKEHEFERLINEVPEKENDLNTAEERASLTRFLVESGNLLHYSDQLGALNTLYFLDPAWLCEALVKVMLKGNKSMEGGKIPRSEVETLYRNDARFPIAHLDQYIKLLERFEIAVSVKNQKLYFPSKLPEQRPGMELPSQCDQSKKISRLYKMAVIPSGFWTRLLTRLMMKVEDFSGNLWYHKPNSAQSFHGSMFRGTLKRFPQRGDSRAKSQIGLHIKKPFTIYWREGMFVSHEEGYFQVEPVRFDSRDGSSDGELEAGVLITEQSTNNNFAIMGIIVDEIEDIVQDFYPGLLEPDQLTMRNRLERYALCRVCYEEKGKLLCHINHFTVEMCSRLLSNGDEICCSVKGVKQFLPDLVPDLLMHELPQKFLLDKDKLRVVECQDSLLGEGVSGAVFRGKYGDTDVAVKLYRSDVRYSPRNAQGESSDSGTSTLSSVESVKEEEDIEDYYNFKMKVPMDLDEAESIKAFQALKGMRQEVALTSRLQHPFVVSLVGILFRPKLMMALELAPFGSLRGILDQEMAGRRFDKHRDRQKIFPLVFSKELTFKILYQIAKGLDYLHTNGIIYKDLKTDNVLVMSKSLTDLVNVKLSDYGISKYSWSGGSVGMVGTPGYQAPEILDGLPYDEKVDIYAYSMVIYEVMSGRRPFEELENLAQITKAIKIQGKKPNLKDYNVDSQFPYMEDMMARCWNDVAVERPPASAICSRRNMESTQFLNQAATFQPQNNDSFSYETVLGAANHKTSVLWMWEWNKSSGNRCLTVLDMMTSGYAVYRSIMPGPKVSCVARVGSSVWVGTEGEEIEIYGSSSSGALTKTSTIPLEGTPVQILTHEDGSGEVMRKPSLQVYIAVADGRLIRFQTISEKDQSGKPRVTPKAPRGFREPQSLQFRTDELFCMTNAQNSTEIWVSVENAIEVVKKSIFKVESDLRINLFKLNGLCKIPVHLNATQMEQSHDLVWCMMGMSPYVLQFDANTHQCLHVLRCEDRNVFGKVVLEPFTNTEHEYINTDSDEAGVSLSPSQRPPLPPRKSVAVAQRQTVVTLDPPPLPPKERVDSNASSLDPDEASDRFFSAINKLDSESSVANSSSSSSGSASDTGSQSKARIPSAFTQNVQPDMRWNTLPAQLPSSLNRRSISTTKVSLLASFTDSSISRPGSEDAPPVPPRSPNININGGCHIARSQMPPGEPTDNKNKLAPQSYHSLPTTYSLQMRSAAISDYNNTVTSFVCVNGSLWIGRSSGDICIIDVDRDQQAKSQYGKVISVLCDVNGRNGGPQLEKNVKLNKVGKYVVSTFQIKGDNSADTTVASWDAFGAAKVKQVQRYWQDIKHVEKKLIKGEDDTLSEEED